MVTTGGGGKTIPLPIDGHPASERVLLALEGTVCKMLIWGSGRSGGVHNVKLGWFEEKVELQNGGYVCSRDGAHPADALIPEKRGEL